MGKRCESLYLHTASWHSIASLFVHRSSDDHRIGVGLATKLSFPVEPPNENSSCMQSHEAKGREKSERNIKWHSSNTVVMGSVRARLPLAILYVQQLNLYIRGSRKSVTGVRFALDDGAGMCLHCFITRVVC